MMTKLMLPKESLWNKIFVLALKINFKNTKNAIFTSQETLTDVRISNSIVESINKSALLSNMESAMHDMLFGRVSIATTIFFEFTPCIIHD